MAETEKRTETFRSPTKEGVEFQLLEWQKRNPGVRFEKHIEELPLPVQRSGFDHSRTTAPDRFSPLIEYEIKSAP